VVIFGLLISCFALAQSSSQILIYINGEPLATADFENAFSQNSTVQTLKGNKSTEVQNDLKELVFRTIFMRKLIEQNFRDIKITDSELEAAIKKDRQQLKLSDTEFEKYLKRYGYTAESYRQQILLDLRGERFSEQVIKNLSYTQEEFNFIKSLNPEDYATSSSQTELGKQILDLKANAELEAWLIRLEAISDIQYPEQSLSFTKNKIVATVNNDAVRNSEVLKVVYAFPNLLSYMDLEKYKDVITGNLIDQKITNQRATELNLAFIGSEAEIHNQVLNYESRNAIVSDTKAEEYFKQNLTSFQTPATARVKSVAFPNLQQAQSFRAALLKNGDLTRTAKQFNAPVSEHNRTRPNDWALESRNAIFGKPTQKVGKIEVSIIAKVNKQFVVYVIQDRIKTIKPTFLQVRSQIQKILMPLARTEMWVAWLKKARANAEIKLF
jgi:parvulin-like peptidyl-prolyl isomerase